MHLKINNWFGRLGNNIIQIKNCIQIALYYSYETIIIPNHPYFNTITININSIKSDENIKHYNIYTSKECLVERNNKEIITDNIYTCKEFLVEENNKEIITDNNDFFYQTKIQKIDINLFNFNIDVTCYILKKIFTIKGNIELNDNDLVIHIRSGDIFINHPHPSYIMPPLSYYTKILDNNNFNKIYLISEDSVNPVINKLLQLYTNIHFKINNLSYDIELLLSSKNVIESFGSFTNTLLLLSDNIKNIYKPSYQDTFLENSEKIKNNIIYIHSTDLTDYKNKINVWENTPQQREIMIIYNIE